MTLQKNPGEVAALAGYFFQYEIFATEIYNHLLENRLVWVEFASSAAGKLDDVLLGTEDKVIAYQIKQIASSNFSYRELMHSDTESIFQGLFKGWKSFKTKFPTKKIDARFITTQNVSAHDQITSYVGKQKPSFQKFLENFWLQIQKGEYTTATIPKVWQLVFDELVSEADATDDEMISFIIDLKFVFNYKTDQFLYDSYTQAKRLAHITKIATGIAQIVAKKGNVRYNRTQFLAEFGLRDQFETRFQHAFFVDEKHYQPIGHTLLQLASVIKRKNKGYIALVGNAGSGKSTLLTKWLTGSPHKVLKYYAYTNVEMSYEYGYRGEASYFLHDLLVQIRESGTVLQDRLPEKELVDLQRHLGEELTKLSNRDEKVFIIVDGLDHISREQQVTKSLIQVLPLPNAIPDNIYFILGSRTVTQLDELSFEIRQNLTDHDSIVSINPFSKEQINDLALSYAINLSGDLLESLQQNTKGHPLFLRYTIEELKSADVNAYPAIIATKDFSGDIELEYRRFWDKHKTLDEFIHILALIARFRYPYFDLELINNFNIRNADADRINKLAEYYFYKSENIWQFFHNSFKEFLIGESAKNRFSGKFDQVFDQGYHAEIADAIVNVNDSYRFNVIYHWFKAGKFQQINETVSQYFFREQWFSFRNTSIIREDIKLAAQAALKQQNIRTVAICFFAFLEIDQRTGNFAFDEYYDIFLSAGRLDLACSFVFDPVKVLVSQAPALEFSRLLAAKGYTTLAQELFERASPIHLLNGSQTLSRRRYELSTYSEKDEVKLIKEWVNAASIFQPLDKIIARVQGIKITSEESDYSDEPFMPEAILSLANFLIEQGNYDQLTELEVHAKSELDEYDQFDFYFYLIYQQPIPKELKQRGLNFFDNWVHKEHHANLLQYALIYTFVADDAEKRKSAFNLMDTPAEYKKRRSHIRAGGLGNYVFNYARLYYIITRDFSQLPETFLPPSDKPTEKAFDLAFAKMGLAHAWYYHGYPDASAGFFGGLEKLFNIFHHRYDSPLYDHEIIAGKGRFVEQVLRLSIYISSKTTAELLEKLTEEWRLNKRYWSDETIQEIVAWVIENGVDDGWCKRTLDWLEPTLYSSGYLQDIIADGARQARLWTKLKATEQVDACIAKLMSLSLGMAPEKDLQVDQMVSWLGKNQPIPITDVQFYFDRLTSIREKVNSRSHTPADAILKLSLPLGNGIQVFENLLFNRLVPVLDGLEAFLIYLFPRNSSWAELLIKLFTRIIVALDNQHSTRRQFIRKLFDQQPDQQQVAMMVNEMKIYAVAETRTNYLLEIYELCMKHSISPEAIGISKQPKAKDREPSSSEQLHLKDDSYLDKEAVLGMVHSLDDLLTLQGQEDEGSYFSWTDVLIKVIPGAENGQLAKFITHFNVDINTEYIIRITDALQASGKQGLAHAMLERTISSSRYCKWGNEYHAKGKISAYQKLQELKPELAVKSAALKDFADALPNMSTSARESMIGELDQIFALFTDHADSGMLYQEINRFRDQLLSNDPPSHSLDLIGNDDDESLLTQLLFFLITIPSHFDYIIYPLLIADDEKLAAVTNKLLRRLFDEGFTIKFLHLLHGLGSRSIVFISFFQDELTTLVNHERADIVVLAWDLLNMAGSPVKRTVQKKDLPLSYTLELSPKMGLVNPLKKSFEHISEEGYLKETNDPLVYTQIVESERKTLAKLTGFKEYNIAYRIHAIGQDAQFPSWCASNSEQELRELYESALDLKIPYSRPQVQKVFDGLGKVVMELYDLGYLDFEDLSGFSPHFDPSLYHIQSVETPPSVRSILKSIGSAHSVDHKWAHEIDEPYISAVLPSFDGDHYILAEITLLQGMEQGKAMETREAFIEIQLPLLKNEFISFPSTTGVLIRDYPHIDQKGIVIYNNALSTLSKANWLAINPLLAHDLGLTLNTVKGNFRWDNASGEPVIESIFWQLGDMSNNNGHHDSEAGYGWRVSITRKGLEDMIIKLEGRPLAHYRQVTRHLQFQQRRFNTFINEKESKSIINEFVISTS
ncbi:hypothetical protein Dfri01_46580 [Dyadobacter frigoris]|uniref:ATP-binding protein n=1 Tax=Dyadobacter frigoris TaxID=2576211 RepID=UPI0024A2C518|nr:ATP-binding protein [Dyadobacter frigoris]GLU55197.1 hypothetical protein Dfri01_46580 [Dyadobacter frigoris]